MYTDYIAQSESRQHERELVERLEHRRIAAERAVQEHGGERLALLAHWAREARAARKSRSGSARPTPA